MQLIEWFKRNYASLLMCTLGLFAANHANALGFEHPKYQFKIEGQQRVHEEFYKIHVAAWPQNKERDLFNAFKFYVVFQKENRTVTLPHQLITLLPGQSLPAAGNFGRSPDTDSFKESWEYELVKSGRWVVAMEGRTANFDQHVPFVEPGYCDLNDCSAMQGWDIKRMAQDVIVATETVTTFVTNLGAVNLQKPAIWGYSLGAYTASAAIAVSPDLFQDFVLFEAAINSQREEMINIQQGWCDQLLGAFEFDVFASSDLYNLFAGLAQAAQFIPNDPIDPFLAGALGFPEGISNKTAFLLAVLSPTGQYLENFVQFLGQVEFSPEGQIQAGLINADIEDVFALVGGLHSVDALMHNFAAECSMAGNPGAREYFDGIENFEGNVFGFGAQFGFGQTVAESVGRFVNASGQSFTMIPFAGHADPIVSSSIYQDVIKSVLQQLDAQ